MGKSEVRGRSIMILGKLVRVERIYDPMRGREVTKYRAYLGCRESKVI